MDFFGILEFWNFGILEFWNFGISEFWNFGILEFRNFGILELWNFGILEFWNFQKKLIGFFGILEFWNFQKIDWMFFGILEFWNWNFGISQNLTGEFWNFRIFTIPPSNFLIHTLSLNEQYKAIMIAALQVGSISERFLCLCNILYIYNILPFW